jgi:predicted RND superfamily exporter protein
MVVRSHKGGDPGAYRGIDLRLARLARFFIRHKGAGLLFQVVVALVCIWAVAGMQLRDDPNAWPPASDPFVKLNGKITQLFGGGDSVSIEVVADQGSIYTVQNLSTIKKITHDLYLVKGVIPYTVRSLATLDSEKYAFENGGDADATMLITPLMPQFPKTAADAKAIEAAARDNPLLDGVLVSKDGKASLIVASFRSEQPKGARIAVDTTEPIAIYRAVSEIIEKYQRPGITIRAAGTPVLIGWVNSVGLRFVGLAFAAFIITIAAILWYGFRSWSGVLLPLRVALMGALMGFGLYRLFFGATLFSAAALLAPFIVVAAGACHSVQFLSRFFFEEYPRLQNAEDAIVSTFVSRLRPMLVSLLCDVIPFAVMAFIPFENVRALGIVTALGLLSLTVDEFLMMIPALSSITITELKSAGTRVKTEKVGTFDRFLAASVRELISNRSTAAAVIAGFVLITFGLGLVVAKAPVGQNNTFAIHNYLTHSWNRSNIYQMEKEITTRFGGVYPMIVLVEAKQEHDKVLETPAVLRAVDSLADYMRSLPHVGSVSDLAFPLKLRHQFVNGDDPKFFTVQETQQALGEAVMGMSNEEPGVYDWLFSEDYSATVIIAYVSTTDPGVVSRLMADTTSHANPLFEGLPVTVSVAGGAVGIAQAFNRNIKYWLIVSVVLGLAGTALLAIPAIGSVSLALLLLVPLAMGSIIALGIMVLFGIELNSNAVAALAIASGVGIDSEVYLLFRVREEYRTLGDFKEALIRAYVNIRRALVVSNGALIFGCMILAPVPLYIGYVGFGMGVVLLVCFLMSAIMSPILWSWFGKRAVSGADPERTPAIVSAESIRRASS